MEQETSVKPEHADGRNWENFPAGLKVLVVDDDPLCLKIIEKMLERCNYEVCTCATAAKALEQLRDRTHNFDLVLSDVYMPDMDGFKLLEAVGLELDLPVIMMSSNGEHTTVMQGVTHGACDFLIKPVRIEELRNIWQHVIRRSRHQQQQHKDAESEEVLGEMDADSSRKRKDTSRDGSFNAEARDEDAGASKKPRVVWSVEMHQQFVQAVNKLGIDKAVPKKILELMMVDGLTRENVASHLQKYRLYLKRVQVVDGSSNHHSHSAAAGSKANAKAASAAGIMHAVQQHQPQLDASLQQQSSLDVQAQQQQQQQQHQQQAGQGALGQPQQQQQQQQMPGVMPGMAANGGLGMLGSFGPQSMPGLPMNPMNAMNPMASMMAGLGQMGMPGMPGLTGMPGMPGMPGLGALGPQAAAAAGNMLGQMPHLSNMGMPGMPGLAGMPGMPGMPPMAGMPGMGQMPGMPGMGQMSGAGMGMQNDPSNLMSMMANMQALFQAQQAATAVAATAGPTSSGGGSSGAPAQGPAATQTLPGLPAHPVVPSTDPSAAAAAAAATAAFMGSMGSGALMHNPATAPAAAAVRPTVPGAAAGVSGVGSSTNGPADASTAGVGRQQLAQSQVAAARAPNHEQADFGSVFDDVFESAATAAAVPVPAAQQHRAIGGRPVTAGDNAAAMDEFLDYFLKG